MICAGCGHELPRGAGRRGRPARFHDGTCRQRAHRARATQRATEALAALDAIETQVSQLRRAILTGQRPLPPEAAWRLTRATDDLAQATGHLADQPSEQIASEPRPEEPELANSVVVTETVTIPGVTLDDPSADLVKESGEPPIAGSRPPRASVTEPVTKPGQRRTGSARRRRPTRPAPLDVDTVRIEHGADPGVWRVLAGETTQPILVGFLEPAYSGGGGTKRWHARTAGWLQVSGGPWRTRKEALVRLVDNYQRAAGA